MAPPEKKDSARNRQPASHARPVEPHHHRMSSSADGADGIYGVISNKAHGHVVTTIFIAMIAMLFTAIS